LPGRRHLAFGEDARVERRLIVVPQAPLAEDHLEPSVFHGGQQRTVYLVAQRGIRGREDADVVADLEHRGLRNDVPAPELLASGDDVVEDHRVHASQHEVLVGVDVILVAHSGDAVSRLGALEQLERLCRGQRRHRAAPQVRERAEAVLVGGADGEDHAELVVRDRRGHSGPPRRDLLEAAEADLEVAAPQRLVDRRERDEGEPGLPVEVSGDEVGDVDFEADQTGGIGGIGFDVRGAAFGIAAPDQGRGSCAQTWRAGVTSRSAISPKRVARVTPLRTRSIGPLAPE
jgi:hypothetical protein